MIRRRLTLWNSLILCLVTLILAVAIQSLTSLNLLLSVDSELTQRFERMQPAFKVISEAPELPDSQVLSNPNLEGASSQTFRDKTKALGQSAQDFSMPTIISVDHKDLPFGQNIPWDKSALSRLKDSEKMLSTTLWEDPITKVKSRLRVYTSAQKPEHGVRVIFQIATSLEPIYAESNRLLRLLLVIVPVSWLCAIPIGFWLTNRALAPVFEINRAAEAILLGGLHARLPDKGGDEIATLAGTMNQLLENQAEAFERLERFVGDASHELKSPLTAILATATSPTVSTASREGLIQLLSEIGLSSLHLKNIVDDLLFLAKSNDSALAHPEHFALAALLGEVSDRYVEQYEARVSLEVTDHLEVIGERRLMERAITNLVENAFRHGGENVNVSIKGYSESRFQIIDIFDDGVGIRPEEIPKVTEKFYQSDVARTLSLRTGQTSSGVGLGLAIVNSIISAHKGILEITSEVGKGTWVRIKIPKIASSGS